MLALQITAKEATTRRAGHVGRCCYYYYHHYYYYYYYCR